MLDISLPDINGLDVLKALEARRAAPSDADVFDVSRGSICGTGAQGGRGWLSVENGGPDADDPRHPASRRRPQVCEPGDGRGARQLRVAHVSLDTERMPHETLSDREFQTWCMLASGKRLTDIARALSLSVKTVSVYRAHLLEKMKMKLANNAELTFYVMSNRLAEMNSAIAG